MILDKGESKARKRKEMTITLKSKPLPSTVAALGMPAESSRKVKDYKKKGTRGPAWIG